MESTKIFKNDSSEVLVLPPNILEELGINLGNIQAYTNETEIKPGAEALTDAINTLNLDRSNVLSNMNKNICDTDSSILETANLMTASVFLSPTFTNLKSNNVINDLHHKMVETSTFQCNVASEITNTKAIEIIDRTVPSFEKNNVESPEVNKNNCKDMLPRQSTKINITSEEIIGFEKIKELITFEILDTENLVPVPINTIIAKKTANLTNSNDSTKSCKENKKIQSYDDRNEIFVDMLPFNGFTPEERKISVLKLQDQSHKSSLLKKLLNNDVPKILNDVKKEIENNEVSNINHNCEENITSEKDMSSTLNGMVFIDDTDTSNGLNGEPSDFVEINSNNSVENVNFINVSEDITNEELNEKNIIVINGECNNAAVDSVKTIFILPQKESENLNDKLNSDSILQTYDVIPSKVSSFDNTNLDVEQEVAIKSDLSHIENVEICNNNKIINVNKNKVKSKLCIQGVEKPGGESHSEQKGIYKKNLKTYSRGKKAKFSKACFENQDCLMSNLDFDVNINCIINDSHSIKERKTQKFCICKDFGYFSYYDKDIDYQHIHYMGQNGAECSLDTILSIYEEDKLIERNVPELDNKEFNIVVEDEKESFHNVCNICWMNLDSTFGKTEDLEPSEEIKQQAETPQSKIINTEILTSKTNKTVKQFGNIDLQIVSSKPSENLDKFEKKNKKRKIDRNEKDDINTLQKLSSMSNSNDINDSHNVNEIDAEASEVKFNETHSKNVPSTKKVVVAYKSNKLNVNKSIITNQSEKVVVDDTLLNKSKINKIDNNRVKNMDQKINDTIINNHTCETEKQITKKRKRSQILPENSEETIKKKKKENIIQCGVCKTRMESSKWDNHVISDHCFIAWEEGQKFDFDNEDLFMKLKQHLNDNGKLICMICEKTIKRVKKFLSHVQGCITYRNPFKVGDNSSELDVKSVKCGVCKIQVNKRLWVEHMAKEHNYLTWKEGETPLNPNHTMDSTMNSTMNESTASLDKTLDTNNSSKHSDIFIKCGVCQKEVDKKDWEYHIRRYHSYKAWRDGETPLDLEDEEKVYNHLYAMSKKYNGLTCIKCGVTRKYVKVFLDHLESCNSQLPRDTNDAMLQQEIFTCGVCSEKVPAKDWKTHAMTKHYNIAWPEGQTPIDSKNSTAIEKCLKEYKQVYNKYECNECGISRVSAIGFFAHVVQCGKTEEEIDLHRDLCDICNNKYLIIYKNQHMAMHRDQENAKQRKLNQELEKEEKKKQIITKAEVLPERRLAAERARNVIEKYKKYKHNCTTCDFGGDSEEDVKNHKCKKSKYNFSDSEDSVELSSEPESDDSEVNSNLSNEEQEEIQKSVPSKKRKHADPNPGAALFPFSVPNPKSYLIESAEDFYRDHSTSDVLFPQWRTCRFEAVPDELLPNYSPTVEESCRVQLQKGDWKTFKKFEAVHDKKWGSAAFAGGCVQSVSWSPARRGAPRHFVGVAAHAHSDAPRHSAHALHAHSHMLQIWDYGDLRETPKFALGIAHDFGTVWAKDWCPSGTRDILSDSDTKSFTRLGLLAMACSNGSAYVLSVPYPSTITDGEKKIYKLTPVAELRLTRGDRRRFQATAINWPSQKGHSIIIVGYSDGTTASFNLDCDSPLLTETEGDVKIFYPFQDERTHNSCVTAVSSGAGAAGSSSATGGARAGRRAAGRGGGRARCAVTATAACFMPHWPDLLLAGNDAIVYQAPNVLSWCGGGRRLGSQQAVCGCSYCGVVAIAAPPALRLVNAHPVHANLHKTTVALLQIKPLVMKKTKQKNDDLGVRLEPSTYEDAIKKYGVELKIVESFDKSYLQQSNKPRDHYPERFPLSDVTSMAFNPSPKQHKKLAVSIHAGFIFVITV